MITVSLRRLGAAAAVCALGLGAQVVPTSAAGILDGKWSDPNGVTGGGPNTVAASAAPPFCVEDLEVAGTGVPVGFCTATVSLTLPTCVIVSPDTECAGVNTSGPFGYSDTLGVDDTFTVSGTGSCTIANSGTPGGASQVSNPIAGQYVGAVHCIFAFQGTHLGPGLGVGHAKGVVQFDGTVSSVGVLTAQAGSFEGIYEFVGA